MTVARVASLIALLAATALAAYILLGRDDPYRVTAELDSAGQIVKGNEVRIGAANVGTVTAVKLAPSGLAELELTIDEDAAPLRRGTSVAVRANSLAGSANRYVTLEPGPATQKAIPDGGRIPVTNTTSPVDFDAILNSLDKPTRRGLRLFVRGAGETYEGRSDELNTTIKYFAPALSNTTELMRQLSRDRAALDRLLVQGATAVTAIAERRSDLSGAVANTSTTAGAIADQNAALAQSLNLLPGTLRKANTTFVNLRATLDDLDPLVAATKPVTPKLTELLTRTRPLVSTAVPTVRDLTALLDTDGDANDLVDLVEELPPLSKRISTVYPGVIATMNRSGKQVDALRAYTPDIAAAVSRVGSAASYYDANGHYLRVQPSLFALRYDEASNQLLPKTNAERLADVQTGRGARCPGAATQPPPDGSAPVPFAGCSVTNVPPGP